MRLLALEWTAIAEGVRLAWLSSWSRRLEAARGPEPSTSGCCSANVRPLDRRGPAVTAASSRESKGGTYSALSVIIGSTRVALRAGTSMAASDTITTSATTMA